MSSEHPLSIDGLSTQLRRYGRWLDERTDVALGPIDVDVDAGAGPSPGGPPRRPRILAAAAAGIAALALIAVGVGVVADSRTDRPEGISTATADRPDGGGSEVPTSDGDRDRAVPGPVTDGGAPSVDVAVDDAAESNASDPAAQPPGAGDDRSGPAPGADETGGEPDDTGRVVDDGEPTGPDGSQRSEPESDPDAVTTPSTSVLPESTEASSPPADDEDTVDRTDGWGPGGLIAAPANGAILNLNATTIVEAHAMSGATTYTFEAWQTDQLVFSVSGPDRQLIIPSQLISTGPWSLQPGQLIIRATAADASGRVMATGEVRVDVQTGAASSPSPPTFPQSTGP